MKTFLLVVSLILLFAYGYRLMSKLDRSLSCGSTANDAHIVSPPAAKLRTGRRRRTAVKQKRIPWAR